MWIQIIQWDYISNRWNAVPYPFRLENLFKMFLQSEKIPGKKLFQNFGGYFLSLYAWK